MAKLYNNPPVIEVLCDFRFAPGKTWDPTVPGQVYGKVRDQLPLLQPTTSISFAVPEHNLQLSDFAPRPALRLFREDKTAVVQIAENQLTVHHLTPYRGWGVFRAYFQPAFEAFVNAARPSGVVHVLLKYINHLKLSHEDNLQELLAFHPSAPDGLFRTGDPFLLGVESSPDRQGGRVRIQLGSLQSEHPRQHLINLELETRCETPMHPAGVLTWLEDGRQRLRDVFEQVVRGSLRASFGTTEGSAL